MSTTTLPRIHELPPTERQAAYDLAAQRAMDAAREASAAHKARKPDPRSALDYRVWHDMGMACVLVVKHAKRPTGTIEFSRDGGRRRAFVDLAKAKARIQPESTDDFILMVTGRGLLRWINERQRVNILGVTPPLSDARDWTAEQRATWDRLRDIQSTVNRRIQSPPRRATTTLTLTRSDAA